MIDVRRLEILRELDRCGTIAATAQAVNLTPSAVSQQLSALSREAGTAMLEPDGRRVRLTAAAELLLSHAHAVFTHLEHAESDLAAFRRGDAGTVRLGAFDSAVSSIVVPVLGAVAAVSRLRVLVREVQPEGAVDALLARTVDVALAVGAETVEPEPDQRVSSLALLDDVMDVALPPGHRLAHRRAVDLADLADDDWILNAAGTPCSRVILDACARAGFAPRERHQVDEFTGVIALISAGTGVSLLPRLAQGYLPQAPVVILPVAGRSPVRRIKVEYRAGTADQPHIAPLLAALTATCNSLSSPVPGTQRHPLTAVATASA